MIPMSLADLRFLIDIYTTPDAYKNREDYCRDFGSNLIAFDLITESGTPTDRLTAWMNLILSTPLPILRWTDPRTDETVKPK